MAALINLHRPKGFKDSSKFALNPSTGDLLQWEWESLNPEDFSMDKDGNVFHNCDDKQSWSRVVRHGQNANNFFERGASAPQDPQETFLEKVFQKSLGGRTPLKPKFNSSYKGKIQLRTKKYRKKKYKNSRRRAQTKKQQRRKRKREKVFKKAVFASKVSAVPEVDVCYHCLVTSEEDNIFNCPIERFCCDFCEKKFDGVRLTTKCCENCLTLFYRCRFCEDCEKNLGEWSPDWRMKLEIPRCEHPKHCKCQECYQFHWLTPCFNCGMTCHAARACPWRADIAEAERTRAWEAAMDRCDRYYEEYYADYANHYYEEFEQQIRDDYLFGWG